ncbi:MAG: IS5 family transposase [Hyphomicrobiales bacterium]|nr:IS5 family transposase [Hyphomicrobiales bacterium]
MRGGFEDQGSLFSYVDPEGRIPLKHPLRKIRPVVREVLALLDADFDAAYSFEGRPSIPPEMLLSALLLRPLFGIRSERQLMEQLNYNLLFRWFVGLAPDDGVWVAESFGKNRERLESHDLIRKFMTGLLRHPQVAPLLSSEHFSVDGTLVEAWASHKSFRPKDKGEDDGKNGGDGLDFRGKRRKNDTHESRTDPEARLYRKAKGQEARLCYLGHALIENRNGLVVDGGVTHATGTAEREAAEAMAQDQRRRSGRRITLGADKNYDTKGHVAALRASDITPHPAQNTGTEQHPRRSAIDGRTTRHAGYGMSQARRKMIECPFGWGKLHGTIRKTRHRSRLRVEAEFLINMIGYNLARLPRLITA